MATEIDRLVVVFDADFKRMEDKLNQVIAKNKAAKQKVEEGWAGQGGLKAAERAFDSLAEHASAAAKEIPGVGAALAALGPIGLAAAAALGGVLAAAEGAKKFTEMASELERTSKALGLTTQQVQEFDHVATALNIPVDKLRESLGGLEGTIGNLESGLIRGKQLQEFTASLGIGADQLRGWGTLEEQLPHVLDALAKLNAEEREGAAKRLKMDPEVLNSLIEGRDRIADLTAEAHQFGLVWTDAMVKRGAEASVQLKQASDVIKNELTMAFADLAPIIVAVADDIAKATEHLNEFIQSFRKIDDRNQGALETQFAELQAKDAAIRRQFPGIKAAPNTGQTNVDFGTPENRLTAIQNVMSEVGVPLINAAKQAAADARENAKGTSTQIVPTAAKAGPADQTAELDKAAADALDSANKELAAASAALAQTYEQQAADQKAAIDAETTKKLADLHAESLKIAASKNDADREAQQASLAQAAALQQRTAELKKQQIDQELITKLADAQVAQEQARYEYLAKAQAAQAEHLTALAGLATTAKQRRDDELQALAIQQAADRTLAAAKLEEAEALLKAAEAANAPESEITARRQAVSAAQQAVNVLPQQQADTLAQKTKDLETPVQKYADSLKDLNTLMQEDGVNAARSLSNALASALFDSKSAAAGITNVFKQLAEEIVSQVLERSVVGPIVSSVLAFLPAAASGMDFAPGGPVIVGEKGPEIVNIPRGGSVLPNNALRALNGNVGAMGKPAGGQMSLHVSNSYDMRGAAGDQTIARMLQAAHAATVSEMLDALPRVVPGVMAEHALQTG